MPTGMFELDLGDLLKLRKFMKRAPKQFNRVAIGVLNTAAFGTRKQALKTLRSGLVIRNDKFMTGSVRVEKAKTTEKLNRAEAVVGSIKRNRFSGWIEQQTGQVSKKTRTSTLFGRGGQQSGALPVGSRLKRKSIISPDKYSGRTPENRVTKMINDLKRRGYSRSFIVKGSRKFKSGLYKIKSKRKIAAVQRFSSRPIKPKRLEWLTTGRRNYLKSTPLRELWARNIGHVLKL